MVFDFLGKPKVKRITASDESFDEISSARYKVYCEDLGFLQCADYPDKKETDRFDQHAVHIKVVLGKKLAGYCRLIISTGAGNLPISTDYGLNKDCVREPACEVSRFFITKRYRHQAKVRRAIFKLLAEEALDVVKEKSINNVYAIMEDWLLKSLRNRGYTLHVLDKGREFMGAVTFPVKIDA